MCAMLTKQQVQKQIERQKRQEATLKKKKEIQEEKDLYGPNWRQIKQNTLQKELEIEIGSTQTPKITDFQDRYTFFDPINIYKDEDMKTLKIDFNDFLKSEQKYRKAIEDLDMELNRLKNENENENTEPEKTEEQKEFSQTIKEDGTQEVDNILPEYETKEYSTPTSKAKSSLQKTIATYLDRFVPVYSKYICDCCGVPKPLSDYYIVYDISNAARIDSKGNIHAKICKQCANKLFAYYYSLSNKNVEVAMQYLCASLNLYWDVDIFQQARKDYEDSERKGTLIGAYIKTVNRVSPGFSFMDSPFLDSTYEAAPVVTKDDSSADYDWSKEDYENYKAVIRIVGYDPFSSIEDEETRKTLYKDFCSLIDEDLAQDYIKVQSAVTIVKSFLKVRQLDEKQTALQEKGGSLSEQKAISDLKKKELDSITNFSASNGWSERFKSKVSKGETSFTGIMKQLSEKKFENALVNRFDVETGATMQQAADYSMNAIMKQLNLSEAEVWKITQEQYQELVKLRREISILSEELRKAKYSLAEERLKSQVKEDQS